MPNPTDSAGDSDDPFAVAEAAQVAARETVPVDRRTEHVDRRTEPVDRRTEPVDRRTEPVERRTEPVDRRTEPVERRSEPVEKGQPTVLVDEKVLADRPTVKLPHQRKPAPPAGRAPLPVAVAFATLWAAALSYLPVAAVIGLARTLEGQGGLGGAAHAGLAGWLLGHGVPIGTSIGELGLAPLLLTMLIVWRLNRAGLHVTRAIGARHTGSIGQALLVAFATALFYALLGSLAALGVDGRGTDVVPARAAANFFVLGLAGALAGSLRGTDALSVLARRTPAALRAGVRTGLVATLFILAAGAAVTGLSVAIGGGQAADTISAFRTGVAGQAGITLLSLAYGGNAAVWAAAYLLGPGFALGTGSAIRLTEVTVGPLPTLPLLAGLPNGPMGVAGIALLTLPVLAGLAAGWLFALRTARSREAAVRSHEAAAARSREVAAARGANRGREATAARGSKKPAAGKDRAEVPWSLALGGGMLAGPVAGVALGLLCRVSGGPLGDDRLATIGADPWQVGLVTTAVVGASAAAGAAAARAFGPARKG